MPKSASQNVNVIMPVYRGGDHWKLTLDSLTQARHLFNKVLMSFDGPTRDELARNLKAEKKGWIGGLSVDFSKHYDRERAHAVAHQPAPYFRVGRSPVGNADGRG